jgi:hypothetical protein
MKDFLSLLDMYLSVFLVLLVWCVCVFLFRGVHRQTNGHSREISEIVPAHTRAHTCRDHSHTVARPIVGPATGHFLRAFMACVSVCGSRG